MPEGEIIEFLTISLARISGTMLLAVYNYNSPRALVSRSALGILLIILCLILAHIGIQKQFSPHPLVLTLCMTVSALWSNTGTLQLLVDNKIVSASDQFCEAIFPGLFAISCAFLIIGCVGTLHKQGPLPVISFALGLANIHVLAMCNDRTLGPSGIGCNFMIVTTVSLYLVALRFWNILQKNPGQPVETRVHSKNYLLRNHLIVTGVMANMVSSSVLCGRLIGTARILFFGQAHWMFTSALYQLIVSVASFCASDMLNAAFFSFLSILKFVEGYSVFNQPHLSNDPLLPLPFMVVFAVLFGILACMMSLKNLYFGIYTLLFAAYCASLTLPSGIEHIAPQVINLIIFMASIVYMFLRLYLSKAEFKTSQRHGLMEIMNSCLRFPKIKQRTFLFCSYSDGFRFKEVDAIGHAFNTLAVFAIITETRVAFILVIVVGVMVLIAGLLSASAGKTLEGSTFIFYGIWWITFGMVKYLCLCVSVMVFYSALGNICFIILHGFVTACMITVNKVWFINSLAFEALLITILLKTLAILTWKCTIAFSVIFGVVSFYCFLASILNGTVETPHLPWGEPFLKDPQLKQGDLLCILPAKKISSIKKIVEILNVGGICVIPADEGYVIASVCQFPDSVQKVSKIDIENTDNEMSIFITSIEQLQPIKHLLSKLMLDFIEGLWPNPVGFVLPKIGDWLTGFQLATTSSLSGSSKNVIIYVSDCEVTTQIINQVGPIAVRSLPKGAHTHPSQMFPKLRSKVNGILLDEEHNNDDIFTVVDCTQIKRGIVDFVKVGIIPTTQVMNVLHTVMSRRENGFNTLCSVHL
ncbi:hypothetical protein GDO78_013179 [Eleutherodactylus coqui]|uniref:Threonylcarbamoyl-AMP synthase n=2 Tax=Eleutherodactylus coqui TaxID=57060 RepID=A0A8J6F0F1_ELECQ|nr:hypothetical protein GDO78_013179 [Eleutherodactylus coqui]